MTRSELTAQTRFQQSIAAIAQSPARRSPYGLQAQAGYLGARDPQTGDHTFTDAAGVTASVRDLNNTGHPTDHAANAILVEGGKNYVR